MENLKIPADKTKVIELVHLFGLVVDLDRWDESGWIRIKSRDWPDDFGYKANCLILYKDDGEEVIQGELIQSLINTGRNIRSREIKKLLNIG